MNTSPGRAPRRPGLFVFALALPACAVLPPADIPQPVDPAPPALDDWTLACDRDAERWTLDADLTSWTAGVRLTWTADGFALEQHTARSVEAAADGTADRVRLVLSIVADPQDVQRDASTLLSCADPVGAVLEVLALDDDTVTDCATWEDPPPSVLELAPCPSATP